MLDEEEKTLLLVWPFIVFVSWLMMTFERPLGPEWSLYAGVALSGVLLIFVVYYVRDVYPALRLPIGLPRRRRIRQHIYFSLPAFLVVLFIQLGIPPRTSSLYTSLSVLFGLAWSAFQFLNLSRGNLILVIIGLIYPPYETYQQGKQIFDSLYAVEPIGTGKTCDSPALFAHISDVHALSDPSQTTRDGERSGLLKLDDLLKRIATHSPSYLLVTGDVTDHGLRAEWETVTSILANFSKASGTKIIMAPGNHDLSLFFNNEEGSLSQLEQYFVAQYHFMPQLQTSEDHAIELHVARKADPLYLNGADKLRSCTNNCNWSLALSETSYQSYMSQPLQTRQRSSAPQRWEPGLCYTYCRGSYLDKVYLYEHADKMTRVKPEYSKVLDDVAQCHKYCFAAGRPSLDGSMGSPPIAYCTNSCRGGNIDDGYLVDHVNSETPPVGQPTFPLYWEDKQNGISILSLMMPAEGGGRLAGTNAVPNVDPKQFERAKERIGKLDPTIKTVVVMLHYALTRGPGEKWSGPEWSGKIGNVVKDIESSNYFIYSFLLPEHGVAEQFLKFLSEVAKSDISRTYFLLYGHRHRRTVSKIGNLILVEAPNVASERKGDDGFYLRTNDMKSDMPISWCAQ